MKYLIITVLAMATIFAACTGEQSPLKIERQGVFAIGGAVIKSEGTLYPQHPA